MCSTRIKSSFDAVQLVFPASKGMYGYLYYSLYNVKSNKKHFKLHCIEFEYLSYSDHHGPALLSAEEKPHRLSSRRSLLKFSLSKNRGPKPLSQRTSPKYLSCGTVQSDRISSIFSMKRLAFKVKHCQPPFPLF